MRQVVGLEVIGIDTEPLAAEYVLRAQQFGGRGILDDAADLLPCEFGDGVVSRLFEQEVAIGAEKGKSAALPRRLILLPALLRARLQRRLGIEREIETGRTCARLRTQFRIMRLGFLQIFCRQRLVPRRHRPGRGALEHGELRCLLRDNRYRLNRGRAGADDANAQAGEVDALVRPFAGVIDRPAEVVHAREGRAVRRRQTANRHDAEFCRDPVAAIGLDQPAIGILVERCRRDAGIEHDLAAQVEAVGDVVGVSEDFRLRRILLRPVPFLVQFLREREGILQALDVASGAGIAIPVPRSANAAAGFVNPRRESEPSQPMQHVQAGKARADHDRVKLPRFGMTRCTRLSHACPFPLFFLSRFR